MWQILTVIMAGAREAGRSAAQVRGEMWALIAM